MPFNNFAKFGEIQGEGSTDTLVFKQSSTTETPDGRQLVISYKGGPDADDGELDFAAADGGGEAAETLTFTFTTYQDTYLPAVQHHDYDLS